MKLHPIWNSYPQTKAELEQTIQLIEKNIRLRHKEIEAVIKDTLSSGGKLIRPAYTLLFSSFGPEHNPERARALAASIELLHTATLIHDDIVDDSPQRRGKETFQSRYGKDAAVYAGDYLFAVSFRLTSQYADMLDYLTINTQGMERILTGELNQMTLRYNQKMTIRQYLTQIRGKTAELFGLACYVGSLESKQSKKASRNAYRIGTQIGMAFQIMDDVLDYSQKAEVFGKPVLEDVKQGIYTAPLIYAMKKEPSFFEQLLEKRDQMTTEDIQELQKRVIEAGGVEEAYRLAKKYTDKAMSLINQLPDTPEKQIIQELTLKLINRKK